MLKKCYLLTFICLYSTVIFAENTTQKATTLTPEIGVKVKNYIDAKDATRNGVQITEIDEGGAADRATVRVGDVVYYLGQKRIFNVDDFNKALALLKIDTKTSIRVMRIVNGSPRIESTSLEVDASEPYIPLSLPNNMSNELKNLLQNGEVDRITIANLLRIGIKQNPSLKVRLEQITRSKGTAMPVLLFNSMKKGKIGTLTDVATGEPLIATVFQVIGNNEVLIIPQDAPFLVKISNIDTSSMVDGQIVNFGTKLWKVVGTYRYTTIKGGSNTVYNLEIYEKPGN